MNELDEPDTSDSSIARQSSFWVLSTSAHPSMIDFTSSANDNITLAVRDASVNVSPKERLVACTACVKEQTIGGLPNGRLDNVGSSDGPPSLHTARIACDGLEILLLCLVKIDH